MNTLSLTGDRPKSFATCCHLSTYGHLSTYSDGILLVPREHILYTIAREHILYTLLNEQVATAFYSFQEALFRHGLSLVISLETATGTKLVTLNPKP